MNKRRFPNKKTLLVFSVLILVVSTGFAAYCMYGSHKLDELSRMSFKETLAYTTEGRKDALITVGILRNDEATVAVYGEGGKELPGRASMYEIGSITKTFTTALLCRAVSEGRLGFDDTIDMFLDLPRKAHYPTVGSLVTHTSGYQEYYFESPMIGNFLNGRNSFAGITGEMLLNRIGKVDLKGGDQPFLYSNFGMAAIGAVLEKIYDEDYRSLMNGYITGELGLENTRISSGAGELENGWEWRDADAYLPAGAIVSDIHDMLRYAQMQMRTDPGYLSLAHGALAEVDATAGSHARMGIRMDAVGAGWIIDREHGIIWHNGGTGNYNSYIGMDMERQTAVVVLSNLPPHYRIPATVMGIKLLTSLQED